MKEIYEKLEEMAIKGGANSVKFITIEDISLNEWVRQKCEFGCRLYAKRFTCPPFVQPPKETKKRLKEYKNAMLVQFKDLSDRMQWKEIQNLMFGLEREAFLNGLYKAFAYTSGSCKLCDVCPAETLENVSLFDRKKCVNIRIARPSMESAGMDVYQTAKNAGYDLKVVPNEGMCFTSYCLLLLE
jgi:predicted metal-binding protein